MAKKRKAKAKKTKRKAAKPKRAKKRKTKPVQTDLESAIADKNAGAATEAPKPWSPFGSN